MLKQNFKKCEKYKYKRMQLVSSPTNFKQDSYVFLAFEDKFYQLLSQFLLIHFKLCIFIYLFFPESGVCMGRQ